jgi:hypothetical protein
MISLLVFFVSVYLIAFIYQKVVTPNTRKKFTVSREIKSQYSKIVVPLEKLDILTQDYYEDEPHLPGRCPHLTFPQINIILRILCRSLLNILESESFNTCIVKESKANAPK